MPTDEVSVNGGKRREKRTRENELNTVVHAPKVEPFHDWSIKSKLGFLLLSCECSSAASGEISTSWTVVA